MSKVQILWPTIIAIEDFYNLSAKSFFFLITPLRLSRQGIDIFVCLALAVIDFEVVTRKFLSPWDLPGAQTFHLHKSFEIVIVGKHEDFMLKAH